MCYRFYPDMIIYSIRPYLNDFICYLSAQSKQIKISIEFSTTVFFFTDVMIFRTKEQKNSKVFCLEWGELWAVNAALTQWVELIFEGVRLFFTPAFLRDIRYILLICKYKRINYEKKINIFFSFGKYFPPLCIACFVLIKY